jgi:mutator protein MutT
MHSSAHREIHVQTISAFAVIANDANQVLLSRRADDGEWELPGGKADKGESPWIALSREVQEEVAVDVRVSSLEGMYFVAGEDNLVLIFRCSIAGGRPQLTPETADTGWFAPDDLPNGMRVHHGEWLQSALHHKQGVEIEEY